MTVENGEARAERVDPTPTPRVEGGRFGVGNTFGRGRPRTSFTRELRRQADMPSIVRRLIDLIENPRTGAREVLGAIALLVSYTDGKPLARSLSLTASVLPPGFDQMSAESRLAVIADLRRRALTGDVALLESGDDDDDEA